MCGRFALVKSAGELIEEFELSTPVTAIESNPNWNITPTREIFIIRNQVRELATVSWGLIAPWSKDRSEAVRSQSQAINART